MRSHGEAEGYACAPHFEQLPPIVVFERDDGFLLVDGFHRCEAAKRLKQEKIQVELREGSGRDAQEYAALANLKSSTVRITEMSI